MVLLLINKLFDEILVEKKRGEENKLNTPYWVLEKPYINSNLFKSNFLNRKNINPNVSYEIKL